jgi:hypothetical protein
MNNWEKRGHAFANYFMYSKCVKLIIKRRITCLVGLNNRPSIQGVGFIDVYIPYLHEEMM